VGPLGTRALELEAEMLEVLRELQAVGEGLGEGEEVVLLVFTVSG
jgi:hypothetical protein